MNDYKKLIETLRNGTKSPLHVAPNGFMALDVGIVNAIANIIEQLVKERDAAVADLKKNNKCCICKHKKENIQDCQHYSSCGLAYIHFEWRGIQDETN